MYASGYLGPGVSERGSALSEDMHSRIFYGFDEERYTSISEDVIGEDKRVLRSSVSPEEL